ncbi:MAG: hypothetical protein ACLTT1_09945 [[Clostridium] scindens]
MLLDEIDKVSNDYKGDTFSALLEVLDSEQNNKFRDHYLEVPMDLSEVLLSPRPTRCRPSRGLFWTAWKSLRCHSYTENEKLHIAMEHLIPKQIEQARPEAGSTDHQQEALSGR